MVVELRVQLIKIPCVKNVLHHGLDPNASSVMCMTAMAMEVLLLMEHVNV
jgi:hypothetical protein|tara:strand:- start:314 stop:463 length:150 start_codon:yes stop_codon:yes gene_type:complete